MNHREARLLLADLARGRVGGAQEGALERHLESCPECLGWFRAYRFFGDALGEGAAMVIPDDHPASDRLSRWLVSRHELEPARQREVLDHLRRCRSCRDLARSTTAAVREARGLVTGEAPSRPAIPSRRSWSRVGTLAATLAAALLMLPLLPRPQSFLDEAPPALLLALADSELANRELEGTQLIDGGRSLVLSGVHIREGAEVTLRAAGCVTLGRGVSVASGARVTVEIADTWQGSKRP